MSSTSLSFLNASAVLEKDDWPVLPVGAAEKKWAPAKTVKVLERPLLQPCAIMRNMYIPILGKNRIVE